MPQDALLFQQWEKERPYPWRAESFLQAASAPGTHVWVRTSGDRKVGFVVLFVSGPEAYIQNIMVHPAHRRQGHGSALIGHVISYCRERNVTDLTIEVDSGNVPGRSFYQKWGFEMTGERPGAYPRGEKAVVMKKDIQ